jgi:hypothetical protein
VRMLFPKGGEENSSEEAPVGQPATQLPGQHGDTPLSWCLLDQPDDWLKVRAKTNGFGNRSGFTTPSLGDGTDPAEAAGRGRMEETPSSKWL